MKKLLVVLIMIVIASIAWNDKECDHIFVEVQEAEIKVNGAFIFSYSIDTIVYGKHEGNQLVCVKCFHKQKQLIDYGQRPETGFQPKIEWHLNDFYLNTPVDSAYFLNDVERGPCISDGRDKEKRIITTRKKDK